MQSHRTGWRPTAALVCSALIGAQFTGASATRDAFFLTAMTAADRPPMVAASAGLSVLLGLLHWRAVRELSPAIAVPGSFVLSAILLLLDWALVPSFPATAAQALFLQTNALGPLLGFGFWLIVSESTDPATARRSFGRIASAGTLAGLVGALVSALVSDAFGIAAMLPVLAALNLLSAGYVRRLVGVTEARRASHDEPRTVSPGWSSLIREPYIAVLGAVILFGTMGSTFVEQIMNLLAHERLDAESLPRFFAAYYAGVNVLVFAVQTAFVTWALKRLGLALTMASSSLTLVAGSLAALLFPGLVLVTAMYGGASVLYESLFRPTKELFFTSVPPGEQRRIKLIVDIIPNRLGAALGAAIVAMATVLWAQRLYVPLLIAAIGCSIAATLFVRRLNHEYVRNLERSLLVRAGQIDLPDIVDGTTRTTLIRMLARRESAPAPVDPAVDPEFLQIQAIRSGDPARIRTVLDAVEGVGSLVHHVIPLLDSDAIAEDAVRALRKVAEEHVGELTDALLDPNQPFKVRRRLARVFSVCVSQRAVDGLLIGLDDLRFEVRYQCGRSLSAVLEKNERVRIDRARVFDVIRREVAVGTPVWESHRLLETAAEDKRTFVDEFVNERAGRSLAHVFTLLSLVLPAAPLQIAYQAVHATDGRLKGTALEYLEKVLPPDVSVRLLPFVNGTPGAVRTSRSREEIIAELLGSQAKHLEDLGRREPT